MIPKINYFHVRTSGGKRELPGLRPISTKTISLEKRGSTKGKTMSTHGIKRKRVTRFVISVVAPWGKGPIGNIY